MRISVLVSQTEVKVCLSSGPGLVDIKREAHEVRLQRQAQRCASASWQVLMFFP